MKATIVRNVFALIVAVMMIITAAMPVPQARAGESAVSVDPSSVSQQEFADCLHRKPAAGREDSQLDCYITDAKLSAYDRNGNRIDLLDPDHPAGDFYGVRLEVIYALKPLYGTDANGNPVIVKDIPVNMENPSITYRLPENMKIPQAIENGVIYSAANKPIGKYSATLDGLVMLTFTDEHYLQQTSDIKGSFFVEFEATRDTIDEKYEVGTVVILPQIKKRTDLAVKKTHANVNHADGTAEFTIEISSQHGSGGAITLRDTMENLQLPDGATVTVKHTHADGTVTTQTYADIPQQLDGLDAGERYVITYTAKLPQTATGHVETATNTVHVTFHDEDGNEKTETSSTTVTFNRSGITVKKWAGSVHGETVEWTIEITAAADGALDGYRIEDLLNGQPIQTADIVGSVSLHDPQGHATTIDNLHGHVFPNGMKAGTYRITYKTKASGVTGVASENTVKLTPPDTPGTNKPSGSIDASASGNDARGPQVAKTSVGHEFGEHDAVKLTWNVSIKTEHGPLASGWQIKDSIWANHAFTRQQLADMVGALKAELGKALGISADQVQLRYEFWPVDEWHTPVASVDGIGDRLIRQFVITVDHELAQGKSLEFAYKTVSRGAQTNSAQQYANEVEVLVDSKKVGGSWADTTVELPKPTIKKYDLYHSGGGANTQHEYDEHNPVIGWGIELTIPQPRTEEITLTEQVPVALCSNVNSAVLKLADPWGNMHNSQYHADFAQQGLLESHDDLVSFKDGDHHIALPNGDRIPLTVDMNATTLTFTVPQTLESKRLLLELKFTVPKNSQAASGTGNSEYVNTVRFQYGSQSGQATQTITVKPTPKKWQNPLTKIYGGSWGIVENNMLPYTLVVNPDGKTLVQGKNTVTLTDTMEYWPYAVRDGVKIRAYDIALIPESVAIHKMNADGSKGEKLDNRKYPMTYETEEIQPNWAPVPYVNNILRFTLPDATPLIIDYTYAVIVMKDEHGKPITDQIQTGAVGGGAVKNKAVLESGSSAEVPWVVGKFQSGATASIDAMFAYKVDSTNYTATIPGARFKLCKWIGDDWTGGELPRKSYDSYAACVPENETGSQLADGQGPLVSTNGGRWVLVNDNVVAGSDGLVVIQETVAKMQGDVRTFLDANVAYALVETEAPSGYILDPRPHFFHRYTSASQAVHKPAEVESQAMINNAVMYVPNVSQRSPLRIEKRWFAPAENGGEPIPVDKEDGEISVDIYRSSTTMKAGHRYMEYDVKAVNAYNDSIVHDIESGKMVTNSTVTTTIDGYADWMADKTELKVNGETVARGAAVNNYEVTLATDTQIEVVIPNSDQHTYAVERDSEPAENAAGVSKDEEKKLYRKGITVSAKNGWTTMVDDLPRFEMSEDGKLITYFYYSIRETGKAALYQVAKSRSYALDPYENNDGIQLGTIYANNWRYATNGDDTGVELPGTGAEGRSVVLTAVALAMLASSFLLLRKIVQ